MCAAITGAAISAGVAGYQIYQGEQAKKRAKADMNEYERADLDNAFEDMQISTVGSDLMREELQRGSASFVDTLQQGGSRMVTAGLPRVQSGLINGANEARNYLDSQVIARDKMIAGDNVNLRGIREQRDNENLSAISSEYHAGRQDSWSGMLGLASSAMAAGRAIGDIEGVDKSGWADPEIGIKEFAPGAKVEKLPTTASMSYSNPNMMFDPNFGAIGNEFVTRDIFKTKV